MWICCHRVRSLSSSMSDGEIPSFLICLTLHFRNWSEAFRNHPHKELDRSNTAITMTSYMYLSLWLYSQIHKRLNNQISWLSLHTWLPERQDRATKTEDSCHNQAITCHSRQVEFNSVLKTAQDEELALLKHIVQTGWPMIYVTSQRKSKPYSMFCEEMSIEDGLLLKGTCIIVPQALHKEMIQLLHTGHLRLEICLNRAKQSMYWPSLYDELKDLITNCTTCLKIQHQKPTSNKQHAVHEIPVHPWSKLCIWYLLLWRWQLSIYCRLHISFSYHQET